MGLPDWLDQFKNPPASHRQMMFWIWNGEMSEVRITQMLEQYAARGIGGVLVHPRSGFITEYLSPRWWELWRFAVSECRRLGLECHIYDEDGYPSGSAQGRVTEECPDAAPRILDAVVVSQAAQLPDGPFVAAYPLRPDVAGLEHLDGQDAVITALEKGPVLVVRLSDHGRRSFPDLTLPRATQTFIRLTHEQYARHVGEHFGTTVKYAFTDEPGIQCSRGFVWSDYLREEFRREHGYDVRERLGLLAGDGDEAMALRFDYFMTANRLWVRNFARQIHDWCESRGIAFTGHYNEHEWPSPHSVPDSMAAQRWMQAPGIDLLGFQFTPVDRKKNALWLLTMKEAASVARQLGRKRTICESHGGGGYEWGIAQCKPLSDWLFAAGINIINPHLSHQTIVGARKYDWPQTFSDHASWWECYKTLADHDGRMAVALTQGKPVGRVLLLHPTLSAWMHYKPRSFEPGERTDGYIGRLRESQSAIIQELADGQVDFDLGDELVMQELGRVENGRLVVGEAAYDLVVAPPMMETWLESTWKLVDAFVKEGGGVVAVGGAAQRINARPDGRVAALAAEAGGRWIECASAAEACRIVRGTVAPVACAPDGGPLPPDIVCYHRDLGHGSMVHLFVCPWESGVTAEVRLPGKGLIRLDTMTGAASPVPSAPHADGQVIRVELHPSGQELFISLAQEQPAAAPRKIAWKSLALGALSVRRMRPNVLVLDYCALEVNGARHANINTTKANALCWQAHGFHGDPWHGRQYRRTLIDRTFPAGTGFALEYRFHIRPESADGALRGMVVAAERPWLYRVSLNGAPLAFGREPWWDEEVRTAEVSGLVVKGENVLRMEAAPFHILCEIMPVYVLGDFSTHAAGRGFEIGDAPPPALGEWRGHGLHFYPWTVRYEWPFTCDGGTRMVKAVLPRWNGSAARVMVDGADCATLLWEPHECELPAPGKGEHLLAVDVYGNMKNLMGPPFCDGLPGIWSWNRCPDTQPPGSAYRFFPCGLMEAAQLFEG